MELRLIVLMLYLSLVMVIVVQLWIDVGIQKQLEKLHPPSSDVSVDDEWHEWKEVDRAVQIYAEWADVSGELRSVYGSGIILNEQGDILTAYHVYEGIDPRVREQIRFEVTDFYGEKHRIQVECDRSYRPLDFCLIENTGFYREPIRFAQYDLNYHAVGYLPEEGYTNVEISYVEERRAIFDGETWQPLLAAYPLKKYKTEQGEWGGLSGGGIFNEHGEYGGMIVAQGIYSLFIVPANELQKRLAY